MARGPGSEVCMVSFLGRPPRARSARAACAQQARSERAASAQKARSKRAASAQRLHAPAPTPAPALAPAPAPAPRTRGACAPASASAPTTPAPAPHTACAAARPPASREGVALGNCSQFRKHPAPVRLPLRNTEYRHRPPLRSSPQPSCALTHGPHHDNGRSAPAEQTRFHSPERAKNWGRDARPRRASGGGGPRCRPRAAGLKGGGVRGTGALLACGQSAPRSASARRRRGGRYARLGLQRKHGPRARRASGARARILQ